VVVISDDSDDDREAGRKSCEDSDDDFDVGPRRKRAKAR
jgi:hypothetical protein